MKKRLLFALALAASTMASYAYRAGDYVFTNVARYKLTGANMVVNGDFRSGLASWTPVDAATPVETTFAVNEGAAPSGSNSVQVLDGQTALTNGMYQVVPVSKEGTYVVTLDVMNLQSAGYTDLDLTGGNTNYINAYYQTDAAPVLAYTDGSNNVNLQYGENGVSGGYGFSYGSTEFTSVAFSITVPDAGNIIIDLRGLAAGLEIGNVSLFPAEEVFDIRTPQSRIAWINTILDGFEWTGDEDYYGDVKEAIETLEGDIEEEFWDVVPSDLANLNEMITEFLAVNAENVLDLIPTKDGSANTGNNSANWMNWAAKWNKLQSDYKNQAPWTWSTDRWAHKTASANSPMQIQWMRGSAGTWDNIATCTATLAKGVYFWGVSGSGGMMTLNKQRWARSMANACAETNLFFNLDTVSVGVLDPAKYQDYIYRFEVEEDGTEVTFGIQCNLDYSVNPASSGFDVNFLSPILYKMKVAGELTEGQKAYLAEVEKQMEAFKGKLDDAVALVGDDKKPWGQVELAAVINEGAQRYEDFSAFTQEDILDMMDNLKAEYQATDSLYSYVNDEHAGMNLVMNAGVRYVQNEGINKFNELNKPLTDMPTAIKAAQDVLDMRLYESGDQATFIAAINAAQDIYDEKIMAEYSEENAKALVDAKAALEAAVEAYKNSASMTVACSMDFEGAEVVTHEDPAGEIDTYYTIAGTNCEMVLANVAQQVANSYELGYNAADSLGMLRVGGSVATIDLAGVPAKASDIVMVSFDYYYGKLTTKYSGFFLNDAAGNAIASLYYSSYDNKVKDDEGRSGDSFGIYEFNGNTLANWFEGVGSSSAANAAIAAASNKTHFEIILDYGMREMSMTITSAGKGTHKSPVLPLTADQVPAQFMLKGDYNNADRRCWFDNFQVINVAAGETAVAGVAEAAQNDDVVKFIKNGVVNIMSAGKVFNAAGAQIK